MGSSYAEEGSIDECLVKDAATLSLSKMFVFTIPPTTFVTGDLYIVQQTWRAAGRLGPRTNTRRELGESLLALQCSPRAHKSPSPLASDPTLAQATLQHAHDAAISPKIGNRIYNYIIRRL